MSFPAKLEASLQPDELEFLTEQSYEIQVISRTTLKPIKLMGLTTPNFRPLQSYTVPLYIAQLLARQGKVDIVRPDWLRNSDKIRAIYEEEVRLGSSQFAKLDYEWIELGHILIDQIEQKNEDEIRIRNILKDLRELRMSKIRKLLKEGFLVSGELKLEGLGRFELNEIRPFMVSVMGQMSAIAGSSELQQQQQQQQSSYNDDYN